MKILILGGEGMLGHKMYQILSQRFEIYVSFRDIDGIWTKYPMYLSQINAVPNVDALRWETVANAIGEVQPDAVVNCIGIVKQLDEASDPIKSIIVNSLLPHRLAEACSLCGARLVHISTDCVFSGDKGSYIEEDVPDAIDLYGRTKLLGEVTKPDCVTIRTSIIGRDFAKQSGLLEWFLSHRGGIVKGYRNAIYSGMPTQVLARIVGDILLNYENLQGLYHIASTPISKCDLLLKLRDAMNLDIEVEPYDNDRCDRSLSAAYFVEATGYGLPSWDAMISELLKDTTPYDEWRKLYAAT
jgi:dTDP-4-dehydrorhamnose reductase